jgi:hypothetical protein
MDDLFLYLILFIAVLLVVWQALAYLRKFKARFEHNSKIYGPQGEYG